jgi:ketosteroid isomerase-like protein
MKADAKTEAAVLAVMDRFMASYRGRDLDGLLATTVPDDDLLLYGTGIDEKRVGRDAFRFQAERDWAQTETLDFKFDRPHISAAGPVAWVAADGLGRGVVSGQEFTFPMRFTAVFEQRGDQWLMAQSHISLPAAGQEAGDSVPV